MDPTPSAKSASQGVSAATATPPEWFINYVKSTWTTYGANWQGAAQSLWKKLDRVTVRGESRRISDFI